jgi:predicted ABC-type ATPase
MQKPVLWFVAGAHGVGKTSFAFKHISAISGSTDFVNLDEIARGLSPINPEAGARAPAASLCRFWPRLWR